MSDACYTIQATTHAEIHKSIGKLTLIKNTAGQFAHDNVMTTIKKIKRVFAGQFNPGASGPGMPKLLDAAPDVLTNKKSTNTWTVDSILR